MAFLFPKKPKTLSEFVYALNDSITRVGDSEPSTGSSVQLSLDPAERRRPAAEEAANLLAQIRKATWGRAAEDGSPQASQPEPDQLAALAKEVYATDVLVPLIQNLRLLDFDARRDVANFFAFLLKRQPTVDYLLNSIPEVLVELLLSAGDQEVHRTACQVLRECARHEKIVSYVMNMQQFWLFFQYIDDVEFEVATDNFSTFQDFIRNYPELTSRFIMSHHKYLTDCINGLIRSQNYVAKRQSLRLLYQLIRHRRNHAYLLMYTESLENLKLIMRLLKDKSKNIHYEAFQIFKIFVSNPSKPRPILEVLIRNKQKLLDMLDKTHTLADRREDQDFQKERKYVRDRILALPDVLPQKQDPMLQDLKQHHRHQALPSQASQATPHQAHHSSSQPHLPQHQHHNQHHQHHPHGNPHGNPHIGQHQQGHQLHQYQQQQQRHFVQSSDALARAPPPNHQFPGAQQLGAPLSTPQRTPQSMLQGFIPTQEVNRPQQPPSPSRAQVPPAFLNARPASPVLSVPHRDA